MKKTINPRDAWVLAAPESYTFRRLIKRSERTGTNWEEIPADLALVTRMAIEKKAGKYPEYLICAVRTRSNGEKCIAVVTPAQILGEEPMLPPNQGFA